ncbi:MAG: hypothetical protein AAFX08_03565 [Pseudomonadota bacterium]
MIKRASALTALVAAAIWSPAHSEGPSVNVAGGEHSKFSRVVIDAKGAAYELRPGRRRLTILLPGLTGDIALERFNASRSAHRVIKAREVDVAEGARVDFDLTCDCGVKASYGRSGRLILDIAESYPKIASAGVGDGGAPKKAENPNRPGGGAAPVGKARLVTQPEGAVSADVDLDEARSTMLAMLTRAAEDGIVQFKDEKLKGPRPSKGGPVEADERAAGAADAFGASTPMKRRSGAQCRSDDWFFAVGDANLDRPFETVARLQAELVGEFDAADLDVTRRLFWTYAAIGFGDEARALLEAFPMPGAEQQAMIDVARVIAERSIDLEGAGFDLMAPGDCGGMHGLVQAVALAEEDPMRAAERAFETRAYIEMLPTELVREFGPRLGLAAIEAGDWTLAGHFKRVAEVTGAGGAAFQLLSARFDKHRGREDKARAKLETLAREESEKQADALFDLAQEYAASGEAPHEGFAEDAGIVAAISDDADVKKQAVALEAEALMNEGEFSAAFRQIIRTYREAPGARRGLGLAARTLLLEAMMKGEDDARLAALDAYFDFQDFILGAEGRNASTPLHISAARTALDFNLPKAAEYAYRRSGAKGEAAVEIAASIDRLVAVTDSPWQDFAADPARDGPASRTIEETGSISVAEAEAALARAYLAGEASPPEGALAAIKETPSDLARLFERAPAPEKLDAAAASALAETTSVQLRILKEAAHGG